MDEVQVTEHDGVYAVAGAVTFDTARSLYMQLLRVIDDRCEASVTIDFDGVERIDSSAVALLAGLQLCARKHGTTAVFAGLNPDMHSLVTLYGVDWVVDPAQPPYDAP